MTTAWAVHISDLHLGGTIKGGGVVPKATAHDPKALEALSNFLWKFHDKHDGEPRALIVSGDVSANGGDAELALYHTLMNRGFMVNPQLSFEPLIDGFGAVLQIPGNHDFWNGSPLPNPKLNPVRKDHFADTPWRAELLFGQRRVVFHGLCSSSGCTAFQQVLAFGAFAAADLNDATRSVRDASALNLGAPFHVLVLHHSPADRSMLSHSLTAKARTELQNLCHASGNARHQIQGILSGHRHSWLIEPRFQPTASSLGLPAEVRCGTTLQAPSPLMLTSRPRSFYVHEFTETPHGSVAWHATRYDFSGARFKRNRRQLVA